MPLGSHLGWTGYLLGFGPVGLLWRRGFGYSPGHFLYNVAFVQEVWFVQKVGVVSHNKARLYLQTDKVEQIFSTSQEVRSGTWLQACVSDDPLAVQVEEHADREGGAQPQNGVEPIVPLCFRHVGEVHPVDAGDEGKRQEDDRYRG